MINIELEKAVDYLRQKFPVKGILLTGSYAVGIENNKSDLDIRIITHKGEDNLSFKGLKKINNKIISFLGRTEYEYHKKMNVEFFNQSKFEARLIYIGKTLYEEDDCLKKLKKKALFYYDQPILKREFSENDKKEMMFPIHSMYNYLISKDEKSPFFNLSYFSLMKLILNVYSSFLNTEKLLLETKLERLLLDIKYIEKYNLETYPDKYFLNLWIHSMKKENINKISLQKIYNYIENEIIVVSEDNFIMQWKN